MSTRNCQCFSLSFLTSAFFFFLEDTKEQFRSIEAANVVSLFKRARQAINTRKKKPINQLQLLDNFPPMRLHYQSISTIPSGIYNFFLYNRKANDTSIILLFLFHKDICDGNGNRKKMY